jgi:hypothetical protein
MSAVFSVDRRKIFITCFVHLLHLLHPSQPKTKDDDEDEEEYDGENERPGLKPRKQLTSAVWTFGEGHRGDLCPEGGYRAQPRVQSAQLRRATIGPTFALLVRSICRPFRANRSGGGSQGLNPGLSPLAPLGHSQVKPSVPGRIPG